MKQRKPSLPHGTLPCETLGPDDGIDSRQLFRHRSRKKHGHKDHQLCRQVRDALNLLLGSDIQDTRLEAVLVESVLPAPDATRLEVRLRLTTPDASMADVQAALAAASGLMRCEVAAHITRKKTPDLVFCILPEVAHA